MLEMWLKALQDVSPNQEILNFSWGYWWVMPYLCALFSIWCQSSCSSIIAAMLNWCIWTVKRYEGRHQLWSSLSDFLSLSPHLHHDEKSVDLRQAVYRLQIIPLCCQVTLELCKLCDGSWTCIVLLCKMGMWNMSNTFRYFLTRQQGNH